QRGVVALDTLTARSNIGVATASGRVALFDSTANSDLHFGLAVRDAAPLRAVLRADTLDVGDCKLDFHLAGPAAARQFDTRGSLRALVWNNLRLLEANASATGGFDHAWRPARATVDVALSRLVGVPVPITTATAHTVFDDGKSEFDLDSSIDDRHRFHVVGGAQS